MPGAPPNGAGCCFAVVQLAPRFCLVAATWCFVDAVGLPISESLFNKVKKMAKSSLICTALLFAAAAPAHAVGDAAAGAGKIFQCQGCHGIPGARTAFPELYSVPRLGGQHPAYIVQALQGYKRGDRSHPTMRAVAADLSDQDMADIAAYYGAAAK